MFHNRHCRDNDTIKCLNNYGNGERDIEIRSILPVSPAIMGWLIAFHGIRDGVDLQASILQSHDAVQPYVAAILTDGCTNLCNGFGLWDATIGLQLSNKNEIIYNNYI